MLYHYYSAHCCPLSLHSVYFEEHLRRSLCLWRHPAVNPSLRRERKRTQNLVGSVSQSRRSWSSSWTALYLTDFWKLFLGGWMSELPDEQRRIQEWNRTAFMHGNREGARNRIAPLPRRQSRRHRMCGAFGAPPTTEMTIILWKHEYVYTN